MNDKKKGQRVREPVQVYLDQPDRLLLDEIAQKLQLPRTEVLRRGLRRLAERLLADKAPGWSMDTLIGSLDGIDDLPRDLAEKHEEYLYEGQKGEVRSTY